MRTGKSDERTRNSKTLNIEVQRLQNSHEKLVSEGSSEVTALLAEKRFVWNQYNIMENDYKSKLGHKSAEVELARAKIENLLANMEQLESLNNEKDCTIAALESKLEKREADSRKLSDEISRISHELEVLRKHTGASVTPVLNRCISGYRTSGLRVKEKEMGSGSNINARKKASSAQQALSGNGDYRKVIILQEFVFHLLILLLYLLFLVYILINLSIIATCFQCYFLGMKCSYSSGTQT